MRGRVQGRPGQEQALVVIVGEAGVVAGAAAAAAARLCSGHRGPHGAHLLGLAQLLDEETLVAALLVGGQVETEGGV